VRTGRPQALPPNQSHRFYSGGARIDALRGAPAGGDGRPEDWIGSTATSWGEESEGLSRLADGTVLVAFRRGTSKESLDGHACIFASADGGSSWELRHDGSQQPTWDGPAGEIKALPVAERRPGELMDTVADVSAARRDLGWAPSVPFEQGIAELCRRAPPEHLA